MSIMRRNKDQMEASCAACRIDWGGIGQIQPHKPIARGKKLHESGDTLTIEELVKAGIVGGKQPFRFNRSAPCL